MRQLSEQELEWIHARLKSLHIRYTEVYAEIFDHYCTTLENNPAIESPAIIAKLNETFAWSVVKRMEKNLRKASNQQLNRMQLESLKIWKYTPASLSILLLILATSLSVSYWLGTFAFISCVGIAGFSGALLVFFKFRSTLNFSLNPIKEKPINSFSHVLYARFSIYFGLIPYIYLGLSKIDFERIYAGSQFFTFTNLALLSALLFALSLIKVAMDYQSPKLNYSNNQ